MMTLTGTHVQTWRGGVVNKNTFIINFICFLSALMTLLTLAPALTVLKQSKPQRDRLVLLCAQVNSKGTGLHTCTATETGASIELKGHTLSGKHNIIITPLCFRSPTSSFSCFKKLQKTHPFLFLF